MPTRMTRAAAAGPAAATHTTAMKQTASVKASRVSTTTHVNRGTRAEALVHHVTQQPAFLAWAATSAADAPAPATSPRGVAQYLVARVSEVAAQLSSLQHAGDYTRLVVLLAELLQQDMAAGVTPRMIEGGLLDLLRAAASAVASGELGKAPDSVSRLSHQSAHAVPSSAATQRAAGMGGTNVFLATQQSTHGGATGALTAPIESLLPPLIDQTVRKAKAAVDRAHSATAFLDQSEDDAEMEAWENYMATVRVATTTADAVHTPDAAVAARDDDSAQTFKRAAAPVAATAAREVVCTITSLPDALCALIASCTTAPLISLTLEDQQCAKAAVASVARALLEMISLTRTGGVASSTVRLAATKGLCQLLSTYVSMSEQEAAATSGAAQARGKSIAHATRTPGKAKATADVKASPVVLLDSRQLAEMLEDITAEWGCLVARLHASKAMEAPNIGTVKDDDSSDEEEEEVRGAVAAAGSGPVGELYWVLNIALQLLQAQQHVCQHKRTRALPEQEQPRRLLPPTLLPVVLRTLAMLPTTPSLSARALALSRLCVDVLWAASLLAPAAASRQLLYGALPSPANTDGSDAVPSAHEEAGSPAVDFFLALLHQFNATHSLAHREMRDDIVTLLALLLRCDAQFVEDELVTRRVASNDLFPPAEPLAEAEDTSGRDAAALDLCTPLSLSAATVEAINAIVALLFETTCGAELTAGAGATSLENRTGGRGAGDGNEARPSALLSEDAVRSYALRFQSVSISAARRREVVEFKKYGWQMLAVHFDWQQAHLTFREYTNFHDNAPSAVRAGRSGQQQVHHHRSSPIRQVTGEEVRDDAVTAALWGMQLCRLGYFDVLLLYVDLDSTVPAVVTWTREELVLLEEEAWRLFTSMILFTQHLDAAAGGIRVRQRRRYGPASFSRRAGGDAGSLSRSNGLSGASLGAGEEDEGVGFDDDDDDGGVLYGADINFIAAGGVDVALRFLNAAPPEMEAVKRSALVTLAAIARTSSSGEAHMHFGGSYTNKDLALVHRALIEYAPMLVPFLVKMIREVDTHVGVTGIPAAAPPLISSVAAGIAAALTNGSDHKNSQVMSLMHDDTIAVPHTTARWGWLPYSTSLTVVFAWCLLRSIGDVVLGEVGMMRELPDLALNESSSDIDKSRKENGASSHRTDSDASSVHTAAQATKPITFDVRSSAGSLPLPVKAMDGTGLLSCDDEVVRAGHRSYDETIEIAMADDMSSSGSSMGPPPGDDAQTDGKTQRESHRKGETAETPRKPQRLTPANLNDTNEPQREEEDALLLDNTARRRTLLRSMHEDVLLIPELFAAEGGIDALVVWIRYTLLLCLSAREPPASHVSPQQRAPLLQLAAEEVAELERHSDLFLLLLDVFRAIVLGSEGNEEQFVRGGGVHGLLDLIEAFALAHGLMGRAADHARIFAMSGSIAPSPASPSTTTATTTTTTISPEVKAKKGVLLYATTLLSDLLDNCPCALDEFATWHSRHLLISPLTPDVEERWAINKGVEAVQLLLCLWAADLPARRDSIVRASASEPTGLELLRLHLRPALRMALKEEYVCRLLRRRAKMGALEAETIRCYYRYIHAEASAAPGEADKAEQVTDAVVLAYMERLMSRQYRRNAIPAEQQIALLVNDTLGLCLKVYGCLAAVGFDSLHAAETETAVSPSLHVNLSSLERSFLVQIAALPALCVDEISTAMAEVALENDEVLHASVPGQKAADISAWRPTTPDRKTLSAAAAASAMRASELDQIIEVGAQVQQARATQLYHRYLVTQLRQPVAPPADGRPGAVKGAWKTQRRLSATVGGLSSAAATAHTCARGTDGRRGSNSDDGRPGAYAVELAARLSARLATEEHQSQQHIAASVLFKRTMNTTGGGGGGGDGEDVESARVMRAAPPALGSSRTPYTALMSSVHAAAAERHPPTTFSVSSPPRRPAPPLTERHQKRQSMVARSVRKVPLDVATGKDSRKL